MTINYRGRTLNAVRKDIAALPQSKLRSLHRTYHNLKAKGVQDTIFEQMLENELDRRLAICAS